MKRVKGTPVGVIGYGGGTFGESVNTLDASTLVSDMNRQLVGVFTVLMRPNTLNTLEGRFTTPANFTAEEEFAFDGGINITGSTALGLYLNANSDNPLPSPLISNFNNTDYTDADKAKGRYDSSMFTDELNFFWHMTPEKVNFFSAGFAFGLRYLSLNETYKETFYKDISSSYYKVHCTSNMWGLQGIGLFEMNPYHWLTWGIRLTGGWLGVNLGRNMYMNDHDSTVLLTNRSTHATNHGWLMQANLYIQGSFMRGRFSWRLGVDGLWLRGAALATNNINLTQKIKEIQTNESIIFASWIAGVGVDF